MKTESLDGIVLARESDRYIDFFIVNVMTSKDDVLISPKFDELLHGDIYRTTGKINININANGIEFDTAELEDMFVLMAKSLEKVYERRYKDLEEEVNKRVKEKVDDFVGDVLSLTQSL